MLMLALREGVADVLQMYRRPATFFYLGCGKESLRLQQVGSLGTLAGSSKTLLTIMFIIFLNN